MSDFEYTPELYTLCDEDGVSSTFELLDTYEENGEKYYAMVPYFEDPEDLIENNGELVVLKSEYVDGEETLVSIEDDAEYERIGNIMLERIEEMMEEYDDCDCEDCDDCYDDDCGCDCGHCHKGS